LACQHTSLGADPAPGPAAATREGASSAERGHHLGGRIRTESGGWAGHGALEALDVALALILAAAVVRALARVGMED
jgi:hypothetical protein